MLYIHGGCLQLGTVGLEVEGAEGKDSSSSSGKSKVGASGGTRVDEAERGTTAPREYATRVATTRGPCHKII